MTTPAPRNATPTQPPWRLVLGIQSTATQAAWAGLRVMVGYRAVAEGAAAWQLAILTAVFAVPALIAAIPSGRAADRWGGSILNMAGCLIVVGGLTGMVLLPGLGWLMAACAIIGIGNVMSVMGQQAFVAHITQGHSSDQAFGFFTAAASAGQAIGPPITTTLAAGASTAALNGSMSSTATDSAPNTTAGLVISAAIAAIGIALYWPMRRTERKIPSATTRNRSPEPYAGGPRTRRNQFGGYQSSVDLKSVWPALAVSGLVMVCLDMLYTFIPIWALEQGYSSIVAGLLLSLRAAVSMLSRLGLGRLVEKFGRKALLTTTTSMATLGFGLLPLADISAAIALTILIGIGLGIPQPLTMSWAVSLTDPTRHGSVLGWLLSANRLAQITIPLGIGALAAPLGLASVFYTMAAVMATTSVISFSRAQK